MDSLVVGIDTNATSVAYSIFSAATYALLRHGSVTVDAEVKNRPYELAEAFAEEMKRVRVPLDYPVYYIEQPFGLNLSGIAAVERTVGVMLYLLHPCQELINVQRWKKIVGVEPVPRDKTLRKNAAAKYRIEAIRATLDPNTPPKITSKTQIKKRCLELYPELPDNLRPPDLYDAILIGRAGLLINNGDYKE